MWAKNRFLSIAACVLAVVVTVAVGYTGAGYYLQKSMESEILGS